MKLIVKSPVWGDLQASAQQIAKDNRQAALRFLVSSRETFALLARFPEIGRPRSFSQPGIRSFVVKGFRNYIVFYLPTASEVQILAVLHGARDLQALVEARL